jgi:hypothetical protein
VEIILIVVLGVEGYLSPRLYAYESKSPSRYSD